MDLLLFANDFMIFLFKFSGFLCICVFCLYEYVIYIYIFYMYFYRMIGIDLFASESIRL